MPKRLSMLPAPAHSPNFSFLAHHDAALVMVAVRAEQYSPKTPWPR
jgi:hypothetical protein